jgi:hypothetical protein
MHVQLISARLKNLNFIKNFFIKINSNFVKKILGRNVEKGGKFSTFDYIFRFLVTSGSQIYKSPAARLRFHIDMITQTRKFSYRNIMGFFK